MPGESLDSWLVAYAARLRTPIADLGAALGLPPAFLRQPAVRIALGRGGPGAEQLAAATGQPPGELEALWAPIARYGACVRRRFRTGWLVRVAAPMRWTRFCPACLADNGGRWLAAWRLPWWTACPVHGSLLVSSCPGCRKRQRLRPLHLDLDDPQTTACAAPRPGATGRGDHRCGHDLRTAPALPAASVGTLEVQAALGVVLEPSTGEQELDASVEDLADLLVVATHLGLSSPTLSALLERRTGRLGALLAEADAVLREAAGTRLIALASAGAPKRPHPLPRPWHSAGPRLASKVLAIRDPRLRPSDRLRWRTTTSGCRPDRTFTKESVRLIPQALWPDWSVRLRPRHGIDAVSFRIVAAACLLLPGATEPIERLVSGLWEDARSLPRKVSHVLQGVAAAPCGDAVLAALTELADALHAHGGPIDYERRRSIALRALELDQATWERICRRAGVLAGGVRRLGQARLWIWETLTGGLSHQAPPELRPKAADSTAVYHEFALRLPEGAIRGLEAQARTMLDAAGCGAEPLTWSPPRDWVTGDRLPGPEPGSVDPRAVARLLAERLPAGEVAERLGTTIDHVRLLVRAHPQSSPSRPRAGRPSRSSIPEPLLRQIETMVVEQDRTLRSIAAEYGLGRTTIARRFRQEGIPIPSSGGRPKHRIDPSWLRRQYLDHRRTLPDLAAEAGTTPCNVARIARRHGIPLRERGGGSHAASLNAPVALPDPLGRAVLGQGGIERVRRFRVIARSRSIGEAARRLGASPTVLGVQLRRLERASGGRLIVRTPRNRRQPQAPTSLGLLLLGQADAHLGRLSADLAEHSLLLDTT
jgi:AraC-like DNA-binding protein